MKIGTRMPPFAGKVGFDSYAEWLAENESRLESAEYERYGNQYQCVMVEIF